ncbi:MAG: formimidoylglutamate deiminase [Bradymonadaceae bacterium]
MANPRVITSYRVRYVLVGRHIVEDCIVDVAGGRIVAVRHSEESSKTEEAMQVSRPTPIDLGDVALVPGLVNAHSHAFQRAIRGHTEVLSAEHPEDDFWSWRTKMYEAAETFTPEQIEAVSALAFLEMALGGITTVGEFHYIHHQPGGAPYDDPNELAHRVIRSAERVGIRIALLRVAYARGGFGKEASSGQMRFVEPDVDTYLERLEGLRNHYDKSPLVEVGLAPHSIRAVPSGWLRRLGEYARDQDLPLHIHACEQRAELEESLAEYGKTPIEAFADMGILDDRHTLVHATHLSAAELDLMEEHRPTVCACPTTERNLGDGFLPALALARRKVPISLGSDSHTVIDLWEEMRLVEYHERLRLERRNVLAGELEGHRLLDEDERYWPTARMLFPMGTLNGARSLRMPVGSLDPGAFADFVTVDLDHISLIGTSAQTLLADMTLSMPAGAVKDVFVGGRRVVEDGRHPEQEAIIARYRLALENL